MKSKYNLTKENIKLVVIPKDICDIFEEAYGRFWTEKMRILLDKESEVLTKAMLDGEEHIL